MFGVGYAQIAFTPRGQERIYTYIYTYIYSSHPGISNPELALAVNFQTTTVYIHICTLKVYHQLEGEKELS